VISDASTISFQTRLFARNGGFLWTMAILPALLFAVTSTNAQSCLGNPNTGCTHPGLACKPVTTGTGTEGKCMTPSGMPKGELSCVCVGAPVPPPPLFDDITYPTPPAGTDVSIRIDRPNPTRASTPYAITFQPGDTVTIHAGGCVQGGGGGKTWRQYVNPTESDGRYYHGLITIPFATDNLARIQRYWNQQVHIPDTAPASDLKLQLGYEDEPGKYGDNGYYSPDDGPGNQCAGTQGGPAWVELDVVHKGPTPAPTDGGDWDLLWTDYDANSIPLNPDWRTSVLYKRFPNPDNCIWPWMGSALPKCTSQITNTDTASGIVDSVICRRPFFGENTYNLPGHANYFAATYNGFVNWEEKSDPGFDDEYSVDLDTTGQAGAADARPKGVHVEFDSDETIDVLTDDFGLPWWQGLRTAVDQGDSQAHSYLDGDYMVVTGLMGLDFVHTPGPESHPAWSMAVQGSKSPNTDIWSFFVRGWGNEGYCSSDQHYVNYLDNQFNFNLRWPQGATSGTVTSSIFWTNAHTPSTFSVTFIPGKAVQVTFYNLPNPTEQALIGGELHIAWAGTPTAATPFVRAAAGAGQVEEDEPEAYLRDMMGQLSSAQLTVYKANAPTYNRVKKTASALRMQPGVAIALPAKPTRLPQISTAPDTATLARKNAHMDALKKAYGGNLPQPK
jgi:hypothetical protein